MAKKSTLPQSRRHILVFDEDWAFIETHFGPNSFRPLGTGPAIRMIIHQKVLQLRGLQETRRDERKKAPDSSPDSPPETPNMAKTSADASSTEPA